MNAHSPPPVSPPPAASFEDSLRELEGLVQTLESGSAPLEEALQSYEQGMALLRRCQAALTQAEQRIRVLDGAVLANYPVPADPADAGGAE